MAFYSILGAAFSCACLLYYARERETGHALFWGFIFAGNLAFVAQAVTS